MQHLKFAERRVLFDCSKPKIDGEDHAVSPTGLHRQNAIVASLKCNNRRLWRKTASSDLMHSTNVDSHLHVGVVEPAPARGFEPLLADHVKAMQIEGVREIDDERSLRRRVQ
jgi:hypothetical protein